MSRGACCSPWGWGNITDACAALPVADTSMVNYVDTVLGNITAILQRKGVWEDTLIALQVHGPSPPFYLCYTHPHTHTHTLTHACSSAWAPAGGLRQADNGGPTFSGKPRWPRLVLVVVHCLTPSVWRVVRFQPHGQQLAAEGAPRARRCGRQPCLLPKPALSRLVCAFFCLATCDATGRRCQGTKMSNW